MGAYHVGVVLSMAENNLLPKIITGSSVGSVIAALVCTKMDDEFGDLTKDGVLNLTYFDKKQNRSWITGVYVRLRRFWQTGYFLDVTVLRDCVRVNIGMLHYKFIIHIQQIKPISIILQEILHFWKHIRKRDEY